MASESQSAPVSTTGGAWPRLIVVQADKVVERLRVPGSRGLLGRIGVRDLADAKALVTKASLGERWYVGPVSATLMEVGSKLRKSFSDDEHGVVHISQSEAAELRFTPGHPALGAAYVAHPRESRLYYPFSSFHRLTFDHKFAELIRLLTSLGATYIRAEHVRGWSRQVGGNAGANDRQVEAAADAGRDESRSQRVMYEAKLGGESMPRLPEDLVWFDTEDHWKAFTFSRLHHGLSEMNLELDYSDDFGITGNLKLKLEGAGVALGGTYVGHEHTTWNIRAVF